MASREALDLEPGESVLFGYGSLLLKSSMERTLGRQYTRGPVPCRLRGWRRTWSSLFPNERFYYLAGGERRYPTNILYLNISRSEGTLNGLLYVVNQDDIAGFDRREAVYDRVDVRDDLMDVDVKGGPVWVYVGKPPFLLTSPAPVDEAAIRRTYLDIVEGGLSTLGAAFREEYLRSTDVPPPANIVDDRID